MSALKWFVLTVLAAAIGVPVTLFLTSLFTAGGDSAEAPGAKLERPPVAERGKDQSEEGSDESQAEADSEDPPSGGAPIDAVSRYDGVGYSATIDRLERRPNGFSLHFVARGYTDLRRPETSCVEVAGVRIRPRKVILSTERPGHYAGTFTFPYGGAGQYRFRYSCQNDYSAASLFDRRRPLRRLGTVPGVIGTSRFDANFSAAVGPVTLLEGGWFVVRFDASGFSDLREPQTSCVKVGAATIRPAAVSLSVERPDRYVGAMRFQEMGGGAYRFIYSCEEDYSSVLLFRR